MYFVCEVKYLGVRDESRPQEEKLELPSKIFLYNIRFFVVLTQESIISNYIK